MLDFIFEFEVSPSYGLYEINNNVDTVAYLKQCEAEGNLNEKKKCTSFEIQKRVNKAFDKAIKLKKTKNNTSETTVTFVVNSEGKITNVEARGESQAMNREVEKVLENLPLQFIPATRNGEKVNMSLSLNIVLFTS